MRVRAKDLAEEGEVCFFIMSYNKGSVFLYFLYGLNFCIDVIEYKK